MIRICTLLVSAMLIGIHFVRTIEFGLRGNIRGVSIPSSGFTSFARPKERER